MLISSTGVTFSSMDEAERFKRDNAMMLDSLVERVRRMPGVKHADIWLNQFEPSFVAGFDKNDERIVKIPLTA